VFVVGRRCLSTKIGTSPDVSQVFVPYTTQTQHGYDRRVHARHRKRHLGHRTGWLRAAVLGANDGIVSTASIIVGVAAASSTRAAVVTAGVAGLVAGAASMAAGEYVSVSSQADAERADLAVEDAELRADPVGEREELAAIYRHRGLTPALAAQVSDQLSQRDDVLAVHARDELGMTALSHARPFQAAGASAGSFTAGAALPLLAVIVSPASMRIAFTMAATAVALVATGWAGARLGGAPPLRGALRVVVWGIGAMLLTMLVGRAVGTAV
jgi:vacuolar iron transporter family protein